MASDVDRLRQLFKAGHPCVSIVTTEESDALDTVREAAVEDGATRIWQWSTNRGIRDAIFADSAHIADTEHPSAALYYLSVQTEPYTVVLLDLASHLKDSKTLRLLRDVVDDCHRKGGHVVLIDHTDDLPPLIKNLATSFELSLPDERELDQILRETLRQRSKQSPVSANITRDELATVLAALRGLSRRQVRQILLDACCDERFDSSDLPHILAHKRRLLQGGGMLEFIESPVTLDQVGGLRRLKDWLGARKDAMTGGGKEFGLEPARGVLMLGVQGAGKSLAAKAVATAWRWPLLRLDVGSLYDRFIGESERRLRESLQQAERMAPLVLWIDEIEKAFAGAASQSVDGGVSRRMFATLLTWMQEREEPIFLVATANDIEALPPELLRKGRFDEIFFVDLPSKPVREQILAIHIKKRARDPALFDLAHLADLSEGYSGAEIEQAIVSAMHEAFSRGMELSSEGIARAIKGSPPLSVTMSERITALRRWTEGRCVPAD